MDKIDGIFEDLLSYDVWKDTYKDINDKTIHDTWSRIAKKIASVEAPENQDYWEKEFYDLLSDFKITVGGRIYANAGASFQNKTTLINCFVAPKGYYDIDSIEGIYRILLEQSLTLKSEGGWGCNFSFIRPRGSFIHGIGVESPGSIKYMQLFNKSSDVITAGSGKVNVKGKQKIRKGAMMAVLDCWHPDIEEFIIAKQQEGNLDKFNISVGCYDRFMDIICEIEDRKAKGLDYSDIDKWDLIFPDTQFDKYKSEWDGNIFKWQDKGYPIKVYKTVKATDLWALIMQSTYNRNDPGVLFIDRANKTHCWNYGQNSWISSTNPCGEQALPDSGCCNLLSSNLTQFLNKDLSDFDYKKLKHYIRLAVRFADNINDVSAVPLAQYQESLIKRRRIGLGVLGWASSLYLLGIRFGSKEATDIKNKLMKTITHTAIEASIDLAESKGMFVGCEPEKHVKNPYWEYIDLPDSLLKRMKVSGIRNSALFSIQPTGNTSILANIVSGGLEPIFMQEYIRTVIVNDIPDHIRNIAPKFWQGDYTENSYFKASTEGNDNILIYKDQYGVVYKIDKNRGLTREVLCEDYAVRLLKKLGKWDPSADWAVTAMSLSVDEHLQDMTEFARWIDSSISKTINCQNDYPYQDFNNLYLNAYKSSFIKGITTYRDGTMTSVLSSSTSNKSTNTNNAQKRPQDLDCDIHHVSRNKQPYAIIVGLLDNKPYEIFAIKNNNNTINHKTIKGTIKKVKRSKYKLLIEDDELSPISAFTDQEDDSLTRMVSLSLRHNTPIQFIQHQLEKTQGDLNSLARCISRALKKYIPDGIEVSGEECPNCQDKLIRSEGCIRCKSCAFTKC
jgi:ribonucleoside-diphosphate reductase alpha chain